MSNVAIHVFNASPVRTVDVDGTPMFIVKDVAEALGYVDTKQAVAAHCKRVAEASIQLPSSNQRRSMKLIPESDVYRLVMRSKLESAERFQDWVMEEVLPSLRKTGA